MKSPDTGVLLQYYDLAGNKVRSRGGASISAASETGLRIAYQYDVIGRINEIDYPGSGFDVRYFYDEVGRKHGNGLGRLSRIDDASGSILYRYDALGRLKADTRRFRVRGKEVEFTVGYNYDRNGRLSSLQYPNGGRVTFDFDKDRISTIRYVHKGSQHRLIDRTEYQAFGGASSWRYANGLIQRLSRDRDGRVENIRLEKGGATRVWAQTYKYNARSQLESLVVDSTEYRYEYDALNRLITEARQSDEIITTKYRYDASGNRVKLEKISSEESLTRRALYHPGSNRLLSNGDTQYLLSGNGNVLVESSPGRDRRYIYNQNNQAIAAYINGRLGAAYAYNSMGQRTHRLLIGEREARHTVFHYDIHGKLVGETDWDANQESRRSRFYVWWDQRPIAVIDHDGGAEARISYLHTDHLNTPRRATDARGRIVWKWASDAFGVGQENLDADSEGQLISIPLRFPGQYYDGETGLHYNYHRYYDPETGRYTQSDPIGFHGGLNTYTYVSANPISRVDPLGLFLFAFDGTGNNALDSTLTKSNIAHLHDYYKVANQGDSLYYKGVGTDGGLEDYWDGLTGLGSRSRVNEALSLLDNLLEAPSWDKTIDIIGFSRGAAIAREFANQIYERLDTGRLVGVTECEPLNIRFMGLFDTVGSMGLPGNSLDAGYDFRIDARIGTVAQAVALNEHRWTFPLTSISPEGGADLDAGRLIEQGFIGAHSDVGGGYHDSDLSDVALQWMYNQMLSAGLEMADLSDEHMRVDRPIIHDERRGDLGAILDNDGDRSIYYPDDPAERSGRKCESWKRRPGGKGRRCIQWVPENLSERQSTAPQFPNLGSFILEEYDDNVRGTVDMRSYSLWLESRGIFNE